MRIGRGGGGFCQGRTFHGGWMGEREVQTTGADFDDHHRCGASGLAGARLVARDGVDHRPGLEAGRGVVVWARLVDRFGVEVPPGVGGRPQAAGGRDSAGRQVGRADRAAHQPDQLEVQRRGEQRDVRVDPHAPVRANAGVRGRRPGGRGVESAAGTVKKTRAGIRTARHRPVRLFRMLRGGNTPVIC